MKITDIPQDTEPRVGDIIEIEQGDQCFEVRIIGITADGYLCEQDNVQGAVLLEGTALDHLDVNDIMPLVEGLRDPKDNPCWKGYHPVGTKKKNGRTVPNCVPNAKESVEEAGPFSYGAKKPRPGSVADLAAKKRREQEKNRPPIEPKDQMVGTAKLTKGVAEGEVTPFRIPDENIEGNYEQMNYRKNPSDKFALVDHTFNKVILTTNSPKEAKKEAIEWAEYDDIVVSVRNQQTGKIVFTVKGAAGAEKYSEGLGESGLQYHTGVKKHGAEYMRKAAQAGREGASQEEIGRLRDRYSKAYKKDVKEGGEDWGSMSKHEFKRRELEHELGHEINRPREQPKGMWFYNVPTMDLFKAKAMGLRQSRSGKWYSTSPNARADQAYGPGRYWEPKNKGMGEAKYHGREVPLGKPMAGDVKKSKVYVRKPNGKVVKVNFGDKDMKIKKSNPKRRKSFRARHNCENPGPRWKARFWSCRAW